MAVSVQVPDLGEDMAGGLVAEWYRADGAPVGLGDPVCRIECSFVAVEVEAEAAGLLRHRRPAGSIERPGVVLGVILADGDAMPSDESFSGRSARDIAEPEPPDAVARIDQATGVTEFLPAFAVGDAELVDLEDDIEAIEAGHSDSVVLPFPRRFAAVEAEGWEEAPGDAVVFDPSMFEHDADEDVPALAEPGSSIPGLPLWEAEDGWTHQTTFGDGSSERFERIAAEASAGAQVLAMSIAIETGEAERMRTVCEREWRRFGSVPLLEDVLFRAIALALQDTTAPNAAGGLVIAEAAVDVSCAIGDPAGKTFREAASAREHGGDATFEEADWSLVSLSRQGIASATPKLSSGHEVAFAVGSADRSGVATLTMSYDSLGWSESSAARLLARIRQIVESPYAMLV